MSFLAVNCSREYLAIAFDNYNQEGNVSFSVSMVNLMLLCWCLDVEDISASSSFHVAKRLLLISSSLDASRNMNLVLELTSEEVDNMSSARLQTTIL